MRQVYVVPQRISNAGVYEIKEGAGARKPTPNRAPNPVFSGIRQQFEALRQSPDGRGKVCQRSATKKGRRKVSRRIMHKPVLLELRSGIDRRRRNQRENDIVEHIDERV